MNKVKNLLKALQSKIQSIKDSKALKNSPLLEKLKANQPLQQIKWKYLPLQVFHVQNRPTIHIIFITSSVYILSYFSAQILSSLLTPSPVTKKPAVTTPRPGESSSLGTLANYSQIEQKNLFKITSQDQIASDDKSEGPAVCESATVKSELPITLMDTIVLQDRVKSVASVQIKDDNQVRKLRIGDKIDQLATVDNINRLKLIIKNLQTGQCEQITSKDLLSKKQSKISVMSTDKAKQFKEKQKQVEGIKNEGNNFKIPKKVLAETLSNPGAILTQAKAVPINNADGTMAFKIVEIDRGGVFDQLGIRDQDTITTINGKKISSMNEVMNMFMGLQNMSSLKLGINRGGSEVTQSYDFSD